jgi:hypothetical protein
LQRALDPLAEITLAITDKTTKPGKTSVRSQLFGVAPKSAPTVEAVSRRLFDPKVLPFALSNLNQAVAHQEIRQGTGHRGSWPGRSDRHGAVHRIWTEKFRDISRPQAGKGRVLEQATRSEESCCRPLVLARLASSSSVHDLLAPCFRALTSIRYGFSSIPGISKCRSVSKSNLPRDAFSRSSSIRLDVSLAQPSTDATLIIP